MEFTCDPDKDATNVRTHGLSLWSAESLDWGHAWSFEDRRKNYGERRMVGLAPLGNHLHVVVYVMRGKMCRVISLRRANRRENRIYAQIQST